MEVHVIPKLLGKIITKHSVPCHVVAMGQVAEDIFPSFDELLYANQHRYTSLEWRVKAANIQCTGTFTVRGHAVVSEAPFVIDLTNDNGNVATMLEMRYCRSPECDDSQLCFIHSGVQPLSRLRK